MIAARLEQAWETRDDPTAFIAGWLAGIFIAPLPVDVVAQYCSVEGAFLLNAIGEEVGCKQGIDRMWRVLAEGGSPESIERALSIVYMELFEGAAGPATVPLYESAYSESGNRLFQQATGDMELLLQQCDVSVIKDCREPPDHLSIELALMSAVLRENSMHYAAMLRDRMLSWIPEFAVRCNESDETGFYSGAAMVIYKLLTAPVLRNARIVA
jgi:TorA-specific chaperone